ncbi:hypothetical protein [Ammoniphilus resinae]|uniref:Na+-translocating membrane potential-generating system MpsC domain-containing protein n=1 Tax=Ammoniphilus resinae TaxID=861532 RepID=A0ABS4GP48_9BACL|nr:hypothetical protein [Ammoniphilus resinae]MBP1932034.1 hypothetical protein [Ammoniphilus resinae]
MKKGNAELIDQIKMRIIDTYADQLKRNKEDSLEFFIRENKVQKVFPEKTVYYERGIEQKIKEQGMNRKQLKSFLDMVDEAITRMTNQGWELYYCTLNINYEIYGGGEKEINFYVTCRDEKHFSWK